MAFMQVLLERYSDKFAWFSLHSPISEDKNNNPFDIPYAYTQRLARPSRLPWLRHYLNLGPWARYRGFQAAKFGRNQNADVIVADLAFDAVVAGRVAARILDVPLLVSVQDDPVTRVSVKEYPGWLVRLFAANFSKTMKAANRCGVVSPYMGEVYEERYGVDTTTLYLGVEANSCLLAKNWDSDRAPLLIGSVGSVISVDNWDLLIKAVDMLNRSYEKEKFSVLHIGDLPKQMQSHQRVEVTGWVTGEEFLYHLSRIDAGFLNLWFDSMYAEIGRTSFPTKIHSYIQAQVPMVGLGPSDSSIVRFVEDYKCGVVCAESSWKMLGSCLEELLCNEATYREAVQGVHQLKGIFSRKQFFKSFESFVGVV
jgi:glycosyltransferase involved in cell wall biosynthesis